MLVEDVVGPSCVPVESGSGYFYAAELSSPAEALVASRQLQFAMEGFRASRTAEPVAISIGIDTEPSVQEAGSDPGSGSEESELLATMQSSRPAQILLTSSTRQQLASFTGLSLRAHSARAEVDEYLWTSAARLEELQADPAFNAALTPSISSDAPAPRLSSRSMPVEALDDEDKDRAMRTGFRIADWPMVMAAVVFILILAGVLLLRHQRPKPQAAPAFPRGDSALPEEKGEAAAAKPPSPPRTAPPLPVPMPAVPPDSGQDVPSSRRRVHRQGEIAKSPAVAKADISRCALEGNTDSYVARAEYDRAAGQYQRAITLFREILECDPNNERAKVGLSRSEAAVQNAVP